MQLMDLNDEAKRRDLRKMKMFSLAFLAVAASIYLYCRYLESQEDPAGWVSFLRAASEAGVVGGLADWFAVTALFKRPMGLPIPHTALIKKKKDQLGENLGTFVGSNFLSRDVVTQRLQSAELPKKAGEWLADPAHADRIATEAAAMLRAFVMVLRDEDVQQVIDNTLVKRIAEPKWGPPLGKILSELLKENRQQPVIELLCDRAYQWALGSQETIDRIVTRDSPTWSPKMVDLLVGEKIHRELVEFAWKVRSDPEHEVRVAANQFLFDFADDLQNDETTIAKAERIKTELMNRREVTGLASAAWSLVKKMILESVDDPKSTLRLKIRDSVISFGERLKDDAALRTKVERWMTDGAGYVIDNYAHEITSIISDTVAKWDADEASDKIELQVGRDLQFIRINGTVVGALAGLSIHSITHLLFA
ncbi:Possible membrane protein [Hoyosella subflava DQS3-9A1]|uniref:Possible membrane protein n=2 Tax=Hoyosella TaxID=697025 RepID=F6EJL3_HOYSD|nr:Possible membrane protein [Hoyosella subflava DQS3-9A1]